MVRCRLGFVVAAWLALSAPGRADDPVPILPVWAVGPGGSKLPQERPTELPNIDPRLDIPPLLRPPPKKESPPTRLRGPRSDYDPAYLYLPDRNPGRRQPPCPCLPLGRWWVNTAYFFGKTQNDAVPALATTGGTGVVGAPGVSILHGDERLDHPFRSGFRLETGLWMDRCQRWGIEGSFFFMESSRVGFEAGTAGDAVLARPFLAEPGDVPAAQVLGGPGIGSALLHIDAPLQFLGADANMRSNLFCEDNVRIDIVAGYRFIRLSEALGVRTRGEFLTGEVREVEDSFSTVNLFNGGQVGLAGEYRFDRLYVGGALKTAFGINWHRLDVLGVTRTQSPGGALAANAGGLLAAASNAGRSRDTSFAVVPEANFTVGYQLGDHWRTYVGYTFVYVSNVARPGQAIDARVGGAFPTRVEANTDFWMHGINLGLEARY